MLLKEKLIFWLSLKKLIGITSVKNVSPIIIIPIRMVLHTLRNYKLVTLHIAILSAENPLRIDVRTQHRSTITKP